ncbi:MAG: hypothetical protein FJ267_03150, partial [Planctomycetes bacterium]|nr:hypothetical protein [Planctomycetota bacterium]
MAVGDTGTGARAIATDVQKDLLADLQRATGFTERTAKAVTFTVPDRDGNGRPETLRYAWSGTAGNPLTLQVNGGPVQNIALNVQQFALSYQTKSLVAPIVPDESPPDLGRVLFVSGGTYKAPTFLETLDGQTGTVTPTSQEFEKIDQFVTWGFTVTLISPSQSSAQFTTAFSTNDVVFVSSQADTSKIASTLNDASIGLVSENPFLVNMLGFGVTTDCVADKEILVLDNTHFITQGFPQNEKLRLFDDDETMPTFMKEVAPDSTILGGATDGSIGFLALAKGRKTISGTVVPGRRVQLPWIDPALKISTFRSDGLKLLLNSLQWGAGAGSDGNPALKRVGLDTSGTSSYFSQMSSKWIATPVTLTTKGEMLELSAYVDGKNLPMKLAIYSNNGGKPGALLAQTPSLTSGLGWMTGKIPTLQLSPGTYWLAIAFSNDTQRAYRASTSGITTSELSGQSFTAGFPKLWGTNPKSWA